ncbi:MAG: PAS domain S-box protein, partial [Nitrospinales bacterium]
MRLKIGGKIILLAFILVLGTAGAVGWVSYKGFNRLLVQHELDALGEELELQGIRLGFGIEALRRDVMFLARTPPIQGIVRARQADNGIDPLDGSTEEVWRERLAVIFTEFLQSRPNYIHARFIDVSSQGREIVRVDRLGGSIVTLAEPDLQPKEHRRYFRESIRLKEGQVYLSDITLSCESGEVTLPHVPMLRAAMPVYTLEGVVFGIVVVNMDFSSTLEKIETEHHLNYVTNDKGDFLAHPDVSKTFGFDLGRRHLIQETYPELEEMFSSDRAVRETSVLSGKGDNALAVHFLKAPFDPLRPERFLGLAQAASYREVVGQSFEVRNQILAWTLLLMAAAAGLVLWFVRPLRQIAQVAEGFAGDMSDFQLPVGAQDEIGSLARSFQGMVDKVKAGAKALKESEARVTAVLNNTVDGIIAIDERGIVGTFNPAAEKIFGYAASEVIGQNVSMLTAEPDRSQHDEYIQRYLRTGEAKIIGIGREVTGLRKDGSIFPLDLAVSEMFIGERRLFIGVTRDITERKKVEKQLEAHAVSLEK